METPQPMLSAYEEHNKGRIPMRSIEDMDARIRSYDNRFLAENVLRFLRGCAGERHLPNDIVWKLIWIGADAAKNLFTPEAMKACFDAPEKPVAEELTGEARGKFEALNNPDEEIKMLKAAVPDEHFDVVLKAKEAVDIRYSIETLEDKRIKAQEQGLDMTQLDARIGELLQKLKELESEICRLSG